ncbi:coiled-coil domain-containing protein 12-like [Amphiura filiformis]|uniref:coiled-coil domain-containing protein 12-like n=1 Tax=Amphiura filiformis TaxID=82378 RepID=UPI003B213C60
MATIGGLENEAAKRKERLKALRKKKQGDVEEPDDLEPPTKKAAVAEDDEEARKPVFKNYTPENENLKENRVPKPELASIDDHIQEQLQAAKPEPVVEEVDLVNLAPRKPDWDLKRDVASKLEKLERRTQRAIAELIRERIQSGEDSGDLLSAMNAATQASSQPVDSDED